MRGRCVHLRVGEKLQMNQQVGDHVVVLGASLAGLLAARVLSESYRQVTVVERDELSGTSANRRGVPHTNRGQT